MSTIAPDIQTAASVISIASAMVDKAITSLIAQGGPDKTQTLAYDIAHVAAAVSTAESLLAYGAKGAVEILYRSELDEPEKIAARVKEWP